MVRTMGQIKSEGQPELCLQATKGHPVQMGPCGAMGTSWIVGEMAPSYLEGARYKICNTQLEKCIGDCPSGEKACASAGSGAFLVDEAAAPHFVIKTVRTNLDVTTLALEADRDLCLQVQGFGTCDGACALQGSSPLKFEKCQETRQNFHLPFPPESYGRLRWALYEDRCIEALQSKVQVSPCDARKLVFWRLVPA
ncbi:unnamed protein product [Effrenium voratum]|nr:unnamed protein product [Effrenium voratum]